MTILPCNACGGLTNFSLVARTPHTLGGSYAGQLTRCYAAFQCDNTDCHIVVGGVTYAGKYNGDPVLDHWPIVPVGKAFPDVPESIAAAASKAHKCASIHAGRAAIGLARSVIEAVAKKNEITNGTIESKINQMADADIIGEDTRGAAHAIRQWGNDAMHGDLALVAFDEQDANDVLELMDDVLMRAYQVRARTSSIVSRRQQRKVGNGTTPTP